jgi:hypothetical protein
MSAPRPDLEDLSLQQIRRAQAAIPQIVAQPPRAGPGRPEGIGGGSAHTARTCSGVPAQPPDFFSFRLSIAAAFRG